MWNLAEDLPMIKIEKKTCDSPMAPLSNIVEHFAITRISYYMFNGSIICAFHAISLIIIVLTKLQYIY